MPALAHSHELGLIGKNTPSFGGGNADMDLFAEQSWSPDQLLWGQLLPDRLEPDDAPNNILNVDFSSLSASPEAVRLRRNLHAHEQSQSKATVFRLKRTSILEFPRLNLGTMLRPLGPDDDLLGEMLDDAWP